MRASRDLPRRNPATTNKYKISKVAPLMFSKPKSQHMQRMKNKLQCVENPHHDISVNVTHINRPHLCAVVVCCGCVLWICLCGCVFVIVCL